MYRFFRSIALLLKDGHQFFWGFRALLPIINLLEVVGHLDSNVFASAIVLCHAAVIP